MNSVNLSDNSYMLTRSRKLQLENSIQNTYQLELRSQFDVSASRLDDTYLKSHNSTFEEILNSKILCKTWRLYSATPLWNLTVSNVMLECYSKRLQKDIETAYSVKSKKKVTYCATFSSSAESSKASSLRVHVTCTTNGCSKTIYDAIFVSWHLVPFTRDMKCLRFPFMLCVGRPNIIKDVNAILTNYFDCNISEITFSQLDFKWIICIIMQHIQTGYSESVQFTYNGWCHNTKTLFDFNTSFSELKTIWDHIHDEDTSRVLLKEVTAFHIGLTEHMKNALSIDLSYFNLTTVVLPKLITIDVVGKIKITSEEMLDVLFRYLKDIILRKSM